MRARSSYGSRRLFFTVLLVVCFVVAGVYVFYRVKYPGFLSATDVSPTSGVAARNEGMKITLPAPPYVIFRYTTLGPTYGQLGASPLAAREEAPLLLPLHCERVHFAMDRGVCLMTNRGVFTTYKALIFDADLQPLYELPLNGLPSRARVAPDGRTAAVTVFVSGHSYTEAGFSTQVTLIDLQTGKIVSENMEQFAVFRDGKHLQGADFNFWGVTFANDGRQFYATLGTGGHVYLVKGDLQTRTMRIQREGGECPSLSPDNTKIAFKKKETTNLGPTTWRLSVLDLQTFVEWPLAETRSVDDQAEWLDNFQVLYYLPDQTSAAMTNTWVVQADGQGRPRLFMPQAYSPAVVR